MFRGTFTLEQILKLPENSFETIYRQNYEENMRSTLDSSAVATAIINLINAEGNFSGTYGQLYERLYRHKPNLPNWPTSPKGLSNSLKRHAPALVMAGIQIYFEDCRRNDGIHVEIKKSGADINI